jgi:hypothetical protein
MKAAPVAAVTSLGDGMATHLGKPAGSVRVAATVPDLGAVGVFQIDRRLRRRLSDSATLEVSYEVATAPEEAAELTTQLQDTKTNPAQVTQLTASINSELETNVGVTVTGATVTSEQFEVIVPEAATPIPAPRTAAPAPTPDTSDNLGTSTAVTAMYVIIGFAMFLFAALVLFVATKGFLVGSSKPKTEPTKRTVQRTISSSMHQGVGPYREPLTPPAPVGGGVVPAPAPAAAAPLEVSFLPSTPPGPTAPLTSRSERSDDQVQIRGSDIEATAVTPAPENAPWYAKFFCNCGQATATVTAA